MRAKQMNYPARLLEAKTFKDDDGARLGRVKALVSVFDNVDWQGDRMRAGAFEHDDPGGLVDWRERGDPIPWIWSHDWRDPFAHVGWIPPADAREVDRGLQVAALMNLDEDPTVAKVYELLAKRRVTQFSFAFDVLEEEETDEETDRGWWGVVYDIKRVALYECGPCLLGANEGTELVEVAARPAGRRRPPGKQGRAVSAANRQRLSDAVDLIEQVLASDDAPEQDSRKAKAAIAPHGTATSDDAWDGPANEANLSNDAGAGTYRRAFAWVDSDGDPDVKASYRFIHHFVSSDGAVGAASTRACSTGIAVLNGARGGTTIPAGDRQGVYNHLARHLRDADQEPPELRTEEELEEAAAPPPELGELRAIAGGLA